MSESASQVEAAAADALARGDARAARRLFEESASARPTATAFLGLARACRALDDGEASVAAVDRAIAVDQRNLPALLFKADHLSLTGDARAASSFYRAALRHAATLERVPEDLLPDLRRAQTVSAQYARNYETHLRSKLAETGFDPVGSSPRFAQSLDLVLGKKQLYLQQPSQYFFPELPQIQFYDRSQFPWLRQIESRTDEIRAELMDVLKDESAFLPYVEDIPNRPPPDDPSMIGSREWTACFLWKNGELIEEHAKRCPVTARAVQSAPLCTIPGRAPSILFSRLTPGARIPPHAGFINTRLICHLPLVVPEKCAFRVGNDVRQWTVGETLVFDDTIEHEARNDSDRTRVVLIFDVWRPELTEEERKLVTALLGAIDSYGVM